MKNAIQNTKGNLEVLPDISGRWGENGNRVVEGTFAGDPKLAYKEDTYKVDSNGVVHFDKEEGNGGNNDNGGNAGSLGCFIIVLGIALVIIALIIGISKFNNPVKKVSKYLDQKNYEAAVNLYNDKIYGNEKRESQVDSLVENCITACGDEYFESEVDYDTAMQGLGFFETIKNEELASLAKDTESDIDQYVEDKAAYENGLSLQDSSEYLSAMEEYLTITDGSRLYSDSQQEYKNCRDILLDEVKNPQTEADYVNYISILDGYLKVISTDSEFKSRKAELEKEYAELQKTTEVNEILTKAATAFDGESYADAFELINTGLAKYASDQTLKAKLQEYQEQYVEIITTKANELSDKGKYSDALNLLSEASKIYDSTDFTSLYDEIDQKRAEASGSYNAKKVDFIIYNDSIKSEDQKNQYDLPASVSGVYGFRTTGMVNGFNVTLRVFDSSGNEINTEYGMDNESTSYASLTKGTKYKVTIEERSGTGSYSLYIGPAKETVDISSCDTVNDSIEFEDQENVYTITAVREGIYHFGFTNIVSDFNITARIYDDLGYEIETEYGISNDDGITATFEEGKTYTVKVCQRNGTGNYVMSVGKQSATSNLSIGKSASGTISFVDQKNRYDIELSGNTKYKVDLSGMASGFNVTVRVFDPLDYEIETEYGVANDDFTFTTNSAGTYHITVNQRNEVGTYNIGVSKSN